MSQTIYIKTNSFALSAGLLAIFMVAVIWLASLAYVGGNREALADLVGVQNRFSHGPDKHGDDARLIKRCLEQQGPDLLMINASTGRWARTCHLPDGRWGVQIVEQIDGTFEEITAFPLPYDEIWRVEDYLVRAGYGLP